MKKVIIEVPDEFDCQNHVEIYLDVDKLKPIFQGKIVVDHTTISYDDLEELEEKERWVNSLEAAGVDNWSEYGYAQEIHNGEHD